MGFMDGRGYKTKEGNIMRVAIIMTVVFSLGLLTIGSLDVQAQDGCLLEMRKSANPADDRVFDFLQTGPEDQESEFGLSDPDNPTTVRVIPFGGAVNITELVPSGWKLDSIECVNGTNNCGPGTFIPCLDIIPNLETNSIVAFCLDNDEGSCTFTNVFDPRAVPAISVYGLIAMAGVLGLIAFFVLRRKKAAA